MEPDIDPEILEIYTGDHDLAPGEVLAQPLEFDLAEFPEEVFTGEAPQDLPEVESVDSVLPGDLSLTDLPVAETPLDAAAGTAAGLGTVSMILIGLGVVILLWIIFTYNTLIRSRVRIKEAWADIDVQLKRRYNIIPNLVEAVKGYMTHEREVLENVTKARAAAINNQGNAEEQGKTENMLSGALKTLFAVTESYPDLKANQQFLDLQRELVDAEDKIQAARRFYNGNVRDFNTKVQLFPNNLLAGLFKFTMEKFFEIEKEEEREVVKVDFDSPKSS